MQTIDLERVHEPEGYPPRDDEVLEVDVVDEEICRLYRSYGWIVVVVMTLVLVEVARLVGTLLG